MRVYGASPLYNYVELVFRSKRLFIVSIVLATLIVSTLATLRGSAYTARAMILLTGKAENGMQATDEAQLGSVHYKLNMLSIFLKNPEFIKTAISNAIKEQNRDPTVVQHHWPENDMPVEYHFDTGMSERQLDTFCKQVATSLNWAQNEGILELTCRWPTKQAADIINAFYWEFHDQVVSYETTNSTLQENLLRKLVDDYTRREQAMEKKVIAYKQKHVDQPPVQPDNASNAYVDMVKGLEEMRLSIGMAQKRRDAYALQLKSIPPKITSAQTIAGPTTTAAYTSALAKRNDAQTALDALKMKYQDSHPKVREAQAALDSAEAALAKAEKAGKSNPNLQSSVQVVNPEYVRTVGTINQADAELEGLRASYQLRVKQANDERQRALAAGPMNYEYKWLTDEYNIVTQIRTNLENRLQAAELARKQEAQRSSAETAMVVKPADEPEATGAKSMMLYAAGPILGMIIAFAFSLVAESLDHSLRTPIEVEKHLGKPVLAVLPRMDPPKVSRRQLGSGPDRGQATLPPV